MRLNISVKRAICFLLAVLMLFSVVGCKEKTSSSKKKVVIRDKVVVRDNNDDDTTSSVDSSEPINKVEQVTTRAKRALLRTEEEEETVPFDELHQEEYVPEFEYKNVDFAGNLADYVIVYSADTDKNGAPTNARVLAEKLATFFKDNDNVIIPVKEEKTVTGDEKMIIVGDTAYYKSNLSEQEFAVNIKGDNIVFEGGHIVMAEKAVDWFRTVKREKGKIATLTGTQEDFTSTLEFEGNKYVYTWGDDFDGEESIDTSKWQIGNRMPQWTDLEYLDTKDVAYVENGKLRMTVIRYLSEDSADIGWASCGSVDTSTTMAYRNGYIEFDAKISYTKGIIMPLWLMSTPGVGQYIPKEQYGAAWYSEFDIFETFANGDQWDVSIHRYYVPYDVNIDGERISNGLVHSTTDADGNNAQITTFKGKTIYYAQGGEVITNLFKTKIIGDGWANWGYTTSWRNEYDTEENNKQKYNFTGEALETLNDSYHKYGLLYTKEGYKMYIDGECWLEREWDIDWDMKDGFDWDNNNGFGHDLHYYLIMNQHPYTPESGYEPDMWIDNSDIPISSYISSVRIYQLADDIDVRTPAYFE